LFNDALSYGLCQENGSDGGSKSYQAMLLSALIHSISAILVKIK
jgi:hypothetical protein